MSTMEDEHENGFEDDFSPKDIESQRLGCDISSAEAVPKIFPAPVDPLRNMKSSESYIDTLEKKLQKITGKQKDVVKGRDIINSLEMAKQEHLSRMMNNEQTVEYQDEDYSHNNSITFSIQRKVNPEKQALNPQELLPLVQDDVLAKMSETEDTDGKSVT